MQRAAQGFDAGRVGVDHAFTAHTHPGGKFRALHQPADGVLQRRQERVQIRRSRDRARCQNGALRVDHAGPDLITADIDA
jgi:hypothetical protein